MQQLIQRVDGEFLVVLKMFGYSQSFLQKDGLLNTQIKLLSLRSFSKIIFIRKDILQRENERQ